MTYRKFKADYLFDGYKMLDDKQVLVTDEDGTIREIISGPAAGDNVQKVQGLISPGFINCHCHLELSHLKGRIPMKTGLVSFVLAIMGQRKATAREILDAIEKSERDMLEAGIVAVGDICNTADSLNQKSAGNLHYYNFIELAGWLPAQAESRFTSGKALFDQFAFAAGNAEHLSISPHAPYSVSPALWNLLKTGFSQKTISIHNQESAAEDDFFMANRGPLTDLYKTMKIDNGHFTAPGTTSLAYYLQLMANAKNLLLVHNTFTSAADIARAVAFNPDLYFCLCPNANLFIEDKLPDVPAMIKAGAGIVVGTDSMASNHQLSILDEMKTIKKHFPKIESHRILQWATSNGARALQFDNKLGDFKPGKKPGILQIEFDGADFLSASGSCRRIL